MNRYEHLIAHIRETVPVRAEEIPLIERAFHPRGLKKGEFLLREGDPSNHMRFIVRGCLKAYYLDHDGREHILQFGVEGWWINDLYSYLTDTAATQYIQAVEDSTVLQVHKSDLEKLFDQVPVIERFFRLKIQKAYVALQNRTVRAMSDNAEKRYRTFRQKYRLLEQRIPQYMIASYLGITPEHLSAIRRKMQNDDLS